jgi:hypothetical protein
VAGSGKEPEVLFFQQTPLRDFLRHKDCEHIIMQVGRRSQHEKLLDFHSRIVVCPLFSLARSLAVVVC